METKKYIIEIPDNTAWIQWVKVSDKDGHVCFDFKDPEDLTPYTKPDTEQVRKEAYDKGYQDANVKITSNEQAIAEKAYQRGLIDAWDAARKIIGDDIPASYLVKMFGNDPYSVICRIFDVYSASEAIEKIRQYEQKQEEQIQVGDEVGRYGDRGIITKISDDGDHFNVMWENGSTGYIIGDFKKTGRNFPEIAKVLRKMQEEKE